MHISDTILKLYIFMSFYTSYLPYDRENGNLSSKRNGKDNEFEYNFLIICRYLNLVKNQRKIFIAHCYNTKNFEQIMGKKIYVIFIKFCMKRDHLAHLKGK